MAPEALARALAAGLVACCCLSIACTGGAGETSVAWSVEPPSPVAGTAALVRCRLTDAGSRPVRGARLRLEAHMSHPGMAPVTAALAEGGDGTYEGRIQLTMAGPWTLVVDGQLPDGSRLTRHLELTAASPSR